MAKDFAPVFINNLVTPRGRLSFPHLAKPDEHGRLADGKYKTTLLIPKDGSNFSTLKEAVRKCAVETWGADVDMRQIKMPFRNGEAKAEKHPAYAGCIFVTCKSKNRPVVIGPDRQPLDPEDAYAGCDARLLVTAMSYELAGSPGVTLLLEAVQKISDNTRFGGSADLSAFDDGAVAPPEPGPDPLFGAPSEALDAASPTAGGAGPTAGGAGPTVGGAGDELDSLLG